MSANTLSFVGFTSDTPFSSISIDDPTNGLAIDNFEFATGLTAAVPEPSTWAMMILGFFGLGWMAYRRRQDCRPISMLNVNHQINWGLGKARR
jgi:hypothetical protein